MFCTTFALAISLICSNFSEDSLPTVDLTVQQDELKKESTERAISMNAKDTLVIKLQTRATGYTWKVVPYDDKAFLLLEPPTTESDERKPGGDQYKVYRFSALQSGSLSFTLARRFGTPSNAKRLIVKVSVAPE